MSNVVTLHRSAPTPKSQPTTTASKIKSLNDYLRGESNPELGAVEAAAQLLSDFTEISEDRLALDPLYVLDCLTRYYNEKGYQFQDADAVEELVSFFIEDMNALQFEAAMRGVKKNWYSKRNPPDYAFFKEHSSIDAKTSDNEVMTQMGIMKNRLWEIKRAKRATPDVMALIDSLGI